MQYASEQLVAQAYIVLTLYLIVCQPGWDFFPLSRNVNTTTENS